MAAILALDSKRAVEKSADDGVDEKKCKLKGDCRRCGKATEELTACLCFDSAYDRQGVALCSQCCAKDVTKCEKCKVPICSADTDDVEDFEDCRGLEMCELCGYDGDIPDASDCGAAICTTCYKESGWKRCFCGKVKFCPACSLSGNSAFHRCNKCGTLYCSDESGDCGRECDGCMKTLCCKCLGVSDPRRVKFCDGCEPKHTKTRHEHPSRYSDDDSDSDDGNGYGSY